MQWLVRDSIKQGAEMPTVKIGKVRDIPPNHVNGTPRYEIWFRKNDFDGLPYIEAARVNVDLVVEGVTYTAGIRKSEGTPFAWISPDLVDDLGRKLPLSEVLLGGGYRKNQEVAIEFDGQRATVIKGHNKRIPQEITREHLLKALHDIDQTGVPQDRFSTRWDLYHEGKKYPPKYVISVAGKYALGAEHSHLFFSGGEETNGFLQSRGFVIIPKNKDLYPFNKVLLKKVGKSQYSDGVRIDKEFHAVFNPPGNPLYVRRGTARKVSVKFNGKMFSAEYRFEGTKAKDVDLQRIQFSAELKAEFKDVFPVPNGFFTIKLGDDMKTFMLDHEAIQEADYDKDLEERVERSKKDSKAERQQRLTESPKRPETIQVTSVAYVRNADVVVEVLERANGSCERCFSPAPFVRRKDGTPYLEVHHVQPLSSGGDDTVENAVALCPNCHRQLHYG